MPCWYVHKGYLHVYCLSPDSPRTWTLPSPPGWSVILLSDNASFSPRLRSGIYMKLLIVCSSNRVSLEPAVCQKLRTDSLTSLPLSVLLSERAGRSSPLAAQHDKALAGAEPLGTTLSVPPWRTSRPSTWLPQKCAAEFSCPRCSAEHSRPTLASLRGSECSWAAVALGEARSAPRSAQRCHCIHG